MLILLSSPLILSPFLKCSQSKIGASCQEFSRSGEFHGFIDKQYDLEDSLRCQLDNPLIRGQERWIEGLLYTVENIRSHSQMTTIQRISTWDTSLSSKSSSDTPHRLTGPVQFLLKLLEYWKLQREDAAGLLGFDKSESDFVVKVLQGHALLRGRDARDRLSHLFFIRKSLRNFFRDMETENEWLRESQSVLGGQAPISLLLGGSMEDILLVREYVDTMVGR